MQDRYVGDVGDFGKYALLRRLCGSAEERPLRLGVIWLLFPDENRNGDGRHIGYLAKREFHGLDDDLMDGLRKIVREGRRSVASVLSAGLLPLNTVSCHEPVPKGSSPNDRVSNRGAWIERCFTSTCSCDLVFFDPDNGLEVPSIPISHPRAGKYVYWDELIPFWNRGNALLIYHHINRTTSAARQVEMLMLRFSTEMAKAVTLPLVFRRGSSRVFWLVHHGDEVGQELERRAAEMLCGSWSQHFWQFGWPVIHQTGTSVP
jgi:hypothetical protein